MWQMQLITAKKLFLRSCLRYLMKPYRHKVKRKLSRWWKVKLSYQLEWVSCNENIHKITEGLMRTKKGRICCYGPPGTGKTAWAAWLAEELDMPLLLRQGSDLT